MEKEKQINSFMEHINEIKVMRNPYALFGILASLNKKIKSASDQDLATMIRELSYMIWVSAQMQFSHLGNVERKITDIEEKIYTLNREIKRIKK